MLHCKYCLKSVNHYTMMDMYIDKTLDKSEKLSMLMSNYNYFVETIHIKDLAIPIVAGILIDIIKQL